MRQKYSSRYVRIYSGCDWNVKHLLPFEVHKADVWILQDNIYNDIVDAAAEASIGVYALIWFGFNGDDSYVKKMNDLIRIIKTKSVLSQNMISGLSLMRKG